MSMSALYDKLYENSVVLNWDNKTVHLAMIFQICLAKANNAASLDTVVVQDLSLGDGQAVKNGDTIELLYTGWLLQNHTTGEMFDSNHNTGKLMRLKLGAGKAIKVSSGSIQFHCFVFLTAIIPSKYVFRICKHSVFFNFLSGVIFNCNYLGCKQQQSSIGTLVWTWTNMSMSFCFHLPLLNPHTPVALSGG